MPIIENLLDKKYKTALSETLSLLEEKMCAAVAEERTRVFNEDFEDFNEAAQGLEREHGFYVMGSHTSVAWCKTKEEADKLATRLNYRGGTHYTVVPGNAEINGRVSPMSEGNEKPVWGVVGKMECPACDGKGYPNGKDKCEKCDGKGLIDKPRKKLGESVNAKCPVCGKTFSELTNGAIPKHGDIKPNAKGAYRDSAPCKGSGQKPVSEAMEPESKDAKAEREKKEREQEKRVVNTLPESLETFRQKKFREWGVK